MNPVSIVFFVIIAGAVIWLTIDTIIYIVKKVKAKKLKKQMSEEVKEDNTNQ